MGSADTVLLAIILTTIGMLIKGIYSEDLLVHLDLSMRTKQLGDMSTPRFNSNLTNHELLKLHQMLIKLKC